AVMAMADLFGLYLQGGRVDVALLGGAQIDRYGNLNTTVIGAYAEPTVRLPGSGGACEIATHAGRVFYIMRLARRAFVERLDFQTSPGHLTGGDARAGLGLPGGGPALVVTDQAVLDFANPDREMQVASLYPGATIAGVQAGIAWPVREAPSLAQTPPPVPEELRLLREVLDPAGLYRG
ncbi:MAG TPA: CoA-transferase, partial [Chloroflexia bacterium]|nr:CoA-transferase [Chloroflexia bacterium]